MPGTSAEVRNAYNVWVHQYDTNENATRDLNAAVLRRQPLELAGKSVLEVGCGTGLNTCWLADHARQVVGADFSEGMLRQARRRLKEQRVDLLRTDVTKPWPFAQAFDLVVANLVLEHVRQLEPLFREAHRVLLPGGQLYIAELHPYRQLRGAQAKYRDAGTGEEVLVPAFVHQVSEFVNAGLATGLALRRLGEHRGDADTVPRLLTLSFERA